MPILPYECTNRIVTTGEGSIGFYLAMYRPGQMYFTGELDNIGKLLYKMGESIYIYDTERVITISRKVMTPDDIAYDVWTSIVNCQGNKRGKKSSCHVYVIDNEGNIVKDYHFAGKGE